jgi:hypothetical protein
MAFSLINLQDARLPDLWSIDLIVHHQIISRSVWSRANAERRRHARETAIFVERRPNDGVHGGERQGWRDDEAPCRVKVVSHSIDLSAQKKCDLSIFESMVTKPQHLPLAPCQLNVMAREQTSANLGT